MKTHMTQTLIVSCETMNADRLDAWLQWLGPCLEPLRNAFDEIALEWNAGRAGRLGNSPDLPAIDQADEWMRICDASRMPIRSVSLPVSLAGDEEELGREVALVDGWTDFASYIDAPLVRLAPVAETQWQNEGVIEAYAAVLGYLADMERRVALEPSSPMMEAWPVLKSRLSGDAPEWIGLSYQVDHSLPSDAKPPLSVFARVISQDRFDPAAIPALMESLDQNCALIVSFERPPSE